MEEIEIAEHFERAWPRCPKNRVEVHSVEGGEKEVFLALELGQYQLMLSIIIGKRGGLREQVIFYDPRAQVMLDRLVIASVSTGGSGNIVYDMPELRAAVRRGGSPVAICSERLEQARQAITAAPERWIGTLRAQSIETTGVSAAAVSGGLPSLGRKAR